MSLPRIKTKKSKPRISYFMQYEITNGITSAYVLLQIFINKAYTVIDIKDCMLGLLRVVIFCTSLMPVLNPSKSCLRWICCALAVY